MNLPVLIRTRWLSQSCRKTKGLWLIFGSTIELMADAAVHVSLSFKRIYAEPCLLWLVGWACGPVLGPVAQLVRAHA